MKRAKVGQKQDDIKIIPPDNRRAQEDDQNIIYPASSFTLKTFTSWRQFYDALYVDKQIAKNWFRLTNTLPSEGNYTNYIVSCTLCHCFIQIKVKGKQQKVELIEVIKMDNVHNHNGKSDEQKQDKRKDDISKKWAELTQIYLEKNQNFPLKNLEAYLKQTMDLILPTEKDQCKVVLKSWKQKKQLKTYIQYQIYINSSQYLSKTHKFPLLPQKQTDLLSICIALSQCYLLGIEEVSIVCGQLIADCLNSKGWRQQLIVNKFDQPLKRKWKIIKKLQEKICVKYEASLQNVPAKQSLSLNNYQEINFSLQ